MTSLAVNVLTYYVCQCIVIYALIFFRQRERRHRYEGHSSDSHSSVSRTPSPGRSPRVVRRDRKDRDMRDFENDRERERDRERDRRDDREKFRTESRRRYKDSPLRSLSPRNSR